MFYKDLWKTLKRYEMLIYTTFFKFLIRYRQTIVGPIWVVLQPLAFVLFLGALFVGLSNVTHSEFIPHLAIGYVAWTLLGGFLSRAPNLLFRNRSYILDGNRSIPDAVLIDMLELIIHFCHQLILVALVCMVFQSTSLVNVLWSGLGLMVIMLNGLIYSTLLAIIGSRFKDLHEAAIPLSSILFLATPIIWMPSNSIEAGKGKILEAYMNYNPFYHFLEIFRAPLLSNQVSDLTICFVAATTIAGFVITPLVYRRFAPIVPHWVR